MINRIVFLEDQINRLRALLFDQPGVEGAAFLLCGESRSNSTSKLIVHVVVPIADEDFLLREEYRLSISSTALTRIAKLARHEDLSIIFAHSHPGGYAEFSQQDNREEERLLPFFQSRVPGRIHGTIVLTDEHICGRLFLPERVNVDAIISVGSRIRDWSPTTDNSTFPIFDRQVRAFGKDIQLLLKKLHIGIVGLGGTGSPVAEQLCRLGVGHLSLFDRDTLDVTNVNRVYNSCVTDEGELKVNIAKRELCRIGLDTVIDTYPENITSEETALALRDCDIIFGCTDKELPRAILSQVSLRYCLPIFDLGVLISSNDRKITGVHGRVTTIFPGEACLFCRGRITAETIRVEALSGEDRKSQILDGYAPELQESAPAVIAFTSATASAAICELLQRLTGFMGNERQSSELLLALDQSRVRTNRLESRENCICGDESQWGRADSKPYLDMVWSTRTS